MSLLVADCVGKRFGGQWVLRSASLRAVPGQVRALVGRNGAGKSTLLLIAAGLLAADSGVVHFDGEAFLRPRLARLAAAGLFVIPDVDLCLNSLTVGEQLDVMRRAYPSAVRAKLLETLRLAPFLGARPFQLSGGERRRVELGLAVLRGPRCLLVDEPLRDIAPVDAELYLRTLQALAAEGCAVVISGHEVSLLFAGADHVTWCSDGTTYELGPPVAAARDQRFVRHFLGPVSPLRPS